MHLAKETNRALLRLRKQTTEIAIPKIIDKRTINGIRYLVLIVLVLAIHAQVLNVATENQKSI